VQEISQRQVVALSLARLGFKVLACHHEGRERKAPIAAVHPHGFKSATTDQQSIRHIWDMYPHALVGIVTGPAFQVIDLDGEEGIDNFCRFLDIERQDILTWTTCVSTPSGGIHIYQIGIPGRYIPTTTGKIAPGVDTRGVCKENQEGGYVIAPDGLEYRFVGDADSLGEMPGLPLELLDKVLAGINRHSSTFTDTPSEPAEPSTVSTPYARGVLAGVSRDLAGEPSGARNHKLNRMTFWRLAPLVHCGALQANEVYAALLDACRRNGSLDDDGERKCKATIAGALKDGAYNPIPHPPTYRSQGDVTYPDLLASDNFDPKSPTDNRPASSTRNFKLALLKSRVELSHETFSDKRLIEGLAGHGPALDDDAERALRHLFEQQHRLFFPDNQFARIVLLVSSWQRFNRFVDFLNYAEPQYDGIARLDFWTSRGLGGKDNEYTRAVGAKTLIAAVRRGREPGCKHDEMLILEGGQGIGKSRALRILAMYPEWFGEASMDLKTKELMEVTLGKVILEWSELSGMRRGEVEHIKSLLSSSSDRARKAYGKHATEQPRSWIIIGTTNAYKYLQDDTGDRRAWPLQVGDIDHDWLQQNCFQLWAEAAHRETGGEEIWLSKEQTALAYSEQENRRVENPWEDDLREALGNLTGYIPTLDVWRILGISGHQKQNRMNIDKLRSAMTTLGCTYGHKKRTGGVQHRCWHIAGQNDQRILRVATNEDGETYVREAGQDK